MNRKELKNSICKKLEKMVKETIGRSVPITYHEPKVPECLKKTK